MSAHPLKSAREVSCLSQQACEGVMCLTKPLIVGPQVFLLDLVSNE